MTEAAWEPLLAGEAAGRAREIVLEIAAALEDRAPDPAPGLKGDAAAALLLAQLERPAASAKLESALSAAAAAPQTMALFGGIAGTAWVVDRVADPDDAEQLLAHFDAALLRHLDVPRWDERHDLMSGLAGVGVYAVDRGSQLAAQIAERVVDHLEATARPGAAGVTWRTEPRFLPDAQRRQFPDGLFDLGVAHGVPGVAGMLARFVAAGLHPDRCRRLLQGAIAWLDAVARTGPPRFGTCWPPYPDDPMRVGWCYGDLGVAGALLTASRALESATLADRAVELLRAAGSILQARGAPDAGFCHGAAGFAHVYNVAFQRTRDREMRERANGWLGEVMRRCRPGAGRGGASSPAIDRRPTADATLLSGVVGTALVLLAATEAREPAWQPLFVL